MEKQQQQIELLQLKKELEDKSEELKLINKELESFAYSVSHDLRAPLRAVSGYARILEEDHKESLNPEGKQLLQSVVNNAKRLGTLVENLVEFSRLGKKELQKKTADMNSIVEHLVSELKDTGAPKPSIHIANLLPVEADHSLIKQVWVNLISNAVKFSSKKEKPTIEIGSEKRDNSIQYFIKDNGVGFDMEYSSKLFGVFQRLHDAKEFEGTGIGLAIAQRIITKHGGKIWAEAKVNEGATFYFTLPLHEQRSN